MMSGEVQERGCMDEVWESILVKVNKLILFNIEVSVDSLGPRHFVADAL
jgi:hypothetical protein